VALQQEMQQRQQAAAQQIAQQNMQGARMNQAHVLPPYYIPSTVNDLSRNPYSSTAQPMSSALRTFSTPGTDGAMANPQQAVVQPRFQANTIPYPAQNLYMGQQHFLKSSSAPNIISPPAQQGSHPNLTQRTERGTFQVHGTFGSSGRAPVQSASIGEATPVARDLTSMSPASQNKFLMEQLRIAKNERLRARGTQVHYNHDGSRREIFLEPSFDSIRSSSTYSKYLGSPTTYSTYCLLYFGVSSFRITLLKSLSSG
jgi:hypothetical protein